MQILPRKKQNRLTLNMSCYQDKSSDENNLYAKYFHPMKNNVKKLGLPEYWYCCPFPEMDKGKNCVSDLQLVD